MGRRIIGTKSFIDPDTGEVRHFIITDIPVKDGKFAKVYPAFTKKLIEKLDYINGALKVLIWFVDKYIEAGIPNKLFQIFVGSYEELGKEVGLKRRTVIKHIKKLKELGIILQPHKRQLAFILNPEYIWIGTAENLAEVMRQLSIEFPQTTQKQEKQKEEVTIAQTI